MIFLSKVEMICIEVKDESGNAPEAWKKASIAKLAMGVDQELIEKRRMHLGPKPCWFLAIAAQ